MRAATTVLLVAGLAVVALYLVFPADTLIGMVVRQIGGVAGPLLAAGACAAAARAAPRGIRVPWVFFAVGALSALVGQILLASQRSLQVPGAAAQSFLLLFHLLMATGAAVALRPRPVRDHAAEVALDGALVLAGAMVVVLRFVLEPLVASAGLDRPDFFDVLAGPVASVGAAFFVALLLIWRDVGVPARAMAALAGSAAALALGNVLVAAERVTGGGSPAAAPLDLVWLAGWILLAIAGVQAAQRPLVAPTESRLDRTAAQLRRLVVPGVALLLGAVAIDAALRPPTSRAVDITFGVLGVLLAARIALALSVAERQAEDRRQLAQSRALIEVSHALAAAPELSRALELVTDWACRLLDGPQAGIELLSEDGATLELSAACGLPEGSLGLSFGVHESFSGWVVRHNSPQASPNAATDPRFHPSAREFLGGSAVAAAPLRFQERVLGALWCTRDRPFHSEDIELLGALADQAAIAIENARLFEEVKSLSLTDPLTGLANRRQLERDLAREFAAARRGRKVVAVLFDLDDFKIYNDRYGHLAGDEVLRSFGRILAVETRAMNLAARYGGDEFIVLLSDSDKEGAEIFFNRVCQRFGAEVATLGRGTVDASAGIAEYRPDMTGPDDLIDASDRALYEAKARRSAST